METKDAKQTDRPSEIQDLEQKPDAAQPFDADKVRGGYDTEMLQLKPKPKPGTPLNP